MEVCWWEGAEATQWRCGDNSNDSPITLEEPPTLSSSHGHPNSAYPQLPPRPQQSGCTLTTEAFPAGADVATGHVLAGATVHAGVGFTLIVVNVTVCPAPARVAVTPVALGKNWGMKHRIRSSLALVATPVTIYPAKPSS